MIAKAFLLASRAYGTNFLRQEKSLRDHGNAPGQLNYLSGTPANIVGAPAR
jgi:hypothetical protein